MPPKRTMRRRKYRKARKAKTTVNVNRALAPIPQRYITKMKFAADAVTVDGVLRLNLNSIYDPLRSGAASPDQPYGRDQLALLYNRYRVVACGWRITAPNSLNPQQMGALPSNELYAPANFAELRENPRAKYFVQHPGGAVQLISGKIYLPSLVGRTKAQYMADDRYQAQIDTNPNELAILNVVLASTAGVLLGSGAIVNVLLEYTVEFFDVKTLGSS